MSSEKVIIQVEQPLRNGFISTFAFAWRYWYEKPYTVLLLLILMAIHAIFQVLVPVYTGKLVDSFGNTPESLTAITWIFSYLIGSRIISYICRQWGAFMWHNLATQIMAKIVTQAFDQVERLSTDWHANNFVGSTVRKITRGMWGFDQFGDTVYLALYPHILANIAVIVVLFQNGIEIGILGVLGSLLFFYSSVKLSTDYLKPALEESNQLDSQIGGIISDAITCNSVVKAFATEEYESRKLREITEQWRTKARRAWWRIETLFSVQVILFVLIETGLVGLTIWLWFQERSTAGDVVTIFASFQLAQSQMKELGNDVRNLQRSINDMEDIIHLEKMDLEINETDTADNLSVKEGAIFFENVTFNYSNQEEPIYQNFSLSINGGEKVALIGSSGSGKSTFIKLIQRLYDVTGGCITIDGQNIRNVTKKSLRSAIAMVPQEPILFHRSISENIAYGKLDATQEEIEEAARKAYAHDFIMSLPNGYGTPVGERGVKLSGGERQRVAIARAILADCPILILDEATSSLDSLSEALIQKALENLMTGRTTIIIAHRLSTIKAVDRIFVFSKGRIVEEGNHETLLSKPDSQYSMLYSLQSSGFLPAEKTEILSTPYEKDLNTGAVVETGV
jgi:ATP-binding cassette subfamily B protein